MISEQIGTYHARNYRDLPIGEVYARMLVKGESTSEFRGATIPRDGGSVTRAAKIRSWCQNEHCRRREEVERNIVKWLRSPWVVDEQ